MLDSRLKRRLRRRGLSEEANNIEWENKREVKFLRAASTPLLSSDRYRGERSGGYTGSPVPGDVFDYSQWILIN